MSNLDLDYCILASPDKGQLRNRSFHGNGAGGRPRAESYHSVAKNFSSTRKSSLSFNDFGNPHQDDLRFKRFEQDFRYVNATQLKISIKDILLPILCKKKAFIYKLNFKEDFY